MRQREQKKITLEDDGSGKVIVPSNFCDQENSLASGDESLDDGEVGGRCG